MRGFIRKLDAEKQIPAAAAAELLQLTPASYVGHAPAFAREVRGHLAGMGIQLA